MVSSFADRAEAVRNGSVNPKFDNMLKITNDGRKLALDQRLMNEMLPDEPESKVNRCVDNAFKVWEESSADRGTQLIFCDLSTPKADGTFNVYDDVREKLVARGVPREEVAFIHEYNTETKKAELFAKVRAGQVRILMGSTPKLGAGTNIQDRLIALHHLDCPWKPSDLEQHKEMQEIIQDVINTYDEKIAVENHPDGVFVQYSKNYGCDCGITVCGQYDEDNEFHVEYSFPFFRGTGITSQESVVVERHAEKESYAGACDDMRLGVTLIFYLQNPAEYMLEKYKGNVREGQPLTITGLAREGKILFPVQKDKEAVKVERELTKNRNNLIAAARNGDEEAMEDLTTL